DLTSLHALLTDQQEAFWQWIRFAQLALTLQSTPTPTLRTDWGRLRGPQETPSRTFYTWGVH
ncbi:MAG: hypothetical protein WB460_14590, partial [Candidatus Acidiferrales bacterium]